MGWKRLVMGEKMPDKNDPKYRDRYEKEVSAGRKVARLLRIDKAVAATQRFADRWPRLFLGLVFGIVVFCFVLNVYRLSLVATKASDYQTAVEKQRTFIGNASNCIHISNQSIMTQMNLIQKINFRQLKYLLSAILYPLILGTRWLCD